jgi:hypothetical protein
MKPSPKGSRGPSSSSVAALPNAHPQSEVRKHKKHKKRQQQQQQQQQGMDGGGRGTGSKASSSSAHTVDDDGDDMDDIFGGLSAAKQAKREREEQKRQADAAAAVEAAKRERAQSRKQKNMVYDPVFGEAYDLDRVIDPMNAKVHRFDNQSGLNVFKAHDLGLGRGGDTPLCPFDCNCCF